MRGELLSQSGSSSSRSIISDSSSNPSPYLNVRSATSEEKIVMTEGGSSGYPLVPTIRSATRGAVTNVLDDYGIATEEDIRQVEDQIDRIEIRLERIQDDIEEIEEDVEEGFDELATEDDIRDLLEAYVN